MKAFIPLLLAAGALAFADSPPVPSVKDVANDKPIVLPKMTVHDMMLEYPPIPRTELKVAALKHGWAPPDYPIHAIHASIFEGRATIGVMVDAAGKPTDFVVVRYTDKCFADALIDVVRTEPFTPRSVHGVAVPGAVFFSQAFDRGARGPMSDDAVTVPMTPMDAAALRTQRIMHPDGPPYEYEPHFEAEIDGGGLKSTNRVQPKLPTNYKSTTGKPVKVLVQFMVDETGHVRLPNVESTPSPELIAPVIDAVLKWQFEPPHMKGKPVLVHALEGVTL